MIGMLMKRAAQRRSETGSLDPRCAATRKGLNTGIPATRCEQGTAASAEGTGAAAKIPAAFPRGLRVGSAYKTVGLEAVREALFVLGEVARRNFRARGERRAAIRGAFLALSGAGRLRATDVRAIEGELAK
jgi:hypothetical protein